MIKSYYYAVDKGGQGWFFDYPPVFDGWSWNINYDFDGESANDLYPQERFSFPIPENMTWEDEPIEFKIEI